MKRIALFAASAALFVGVAQAQDEAPRTSVEFEPHTITSQADVEALRAEIASAAASVCAVENENDLSERLQRARCINEAVADGEAQLRAKLAQANPRAFAQLGLSEGAGA